MFKTGSNDVSGHSSVGEAATERAKSATDVRNNSIENNIIAKEYTKSHLIQVRFFSLNDCRNLKS